MALTRARVVSATPGFAAEVEGVIREASVPARATRVAIAGDALEMRRADRGGEGRRRSLGPEICRRRPDRYRIHRAISAARACRGASRDPRFLDRARARQGGARSASLPVEECRSAASRRRSSITISARSCGSACRDRSIRRRPARACWCCSRARATCRISRRLDAHLAETQKRGAAEFPAILDAASAGLIAGAASAVRSRPPISDRAAVDRQPHQHDRAAPSSERMRMRAAVQFDQRFRDRKAEPGAVMGLGELAFDLLERPAELLQRVPRRCRCRCPDRDDDAGAGAAGRAR